MINSNLFWQTRSLTQAREDHLTYFLASALECDAAFRESYQDRVLQSLATAGVAPRIARVQTQAVFAEQSCRPDLLLILSDDRRIACEHKLEAPETLLELDSGEIRRQLERYLELDISGVIYFRPHLVTLSQKILQHPRYIRPASQPHFLWRDLYDSLSCGAHVVTQWLADGFRRLGFTPAAPHVGPLAPDETEDVKENQRNFGKLWHSIRALASQDWKVGTGRRCELYLQPLTPSELCSQVYVSPLAQMGSLLRFRCHTTDAQIERVREKLEGAVAEVPFSPELTTGRLQNGLPFVDVIVSLYTVLMGADAPEEQERRLLKQIAPLLEALRPPPNPRPQPDRNQIGSSLLEKTAPSERSLLAFCGWDSPEIGCRKAPLRLRRPLRGRRRPLNLGFNWGPRHTSAGLSQTESADCPIF